MTRFSCFRGHFFFPAFLLLLLPACAPQVRTMSVEDPAPLLTLQAAFRESVHRIKTAEEGIWHSGWSGNVVVNTTGGEHKGLCYQWQEKIYDDIRPVAETLGWEAEKFNINRGNWLEHNVVIVFDPRHTSREAILAAPEKEDAYILDAWRRGEPDVFLLKDWVRIPFLVLTAPNFEEQPPAAEN